MANASSHLQWLLIRNHHAFTVKRDGITFSRETNNLSNRHSFRSNGLVHARSVGVNVKDGSVVITSRKNRSARKIASASMSVTSRRSNNFPRIAKSVSSAAGGRKELNRVALARWTKIDRSLKAKKKRAAARKNKAKSVGDVA